MKVITFANSKGGVGKTTLTLNLINVLSQLNKNILVFDIDPQANLSRALLSNYTSKQNIELWFKDSEQKELLNSIEKRNLENVLIVPTYNNLVLETNTYVTAMSMGELILKNNLFKIKEILNKKIDYIFFDSFPSMNKTHKAVIEAIKNSEIGEMILKTKIPLSTIKQKETMLMKFHSITDKNPIGFLTNELIEKGVL